MDRTQKPYKIGGYEATPADAYKLMHEGALALAQVENNGMCIDLDYIEAKWEELQGTLDGLQEEFKDTNLWKQMEKVQAKKKGNLSMKADDILRGALYDNKDNDGMGIKSKFKTDGGEKNSVDARSLLLLQDDIPEIETLLRWRKLEKARNTYFAQFRREQRDGMIHALYSLHKIPTFRSSAKNPSVQNFPIRDKEIGELVRRSVKPRPGRRIVEVDYSGAEVRVAACYHKDPNMIREIKDPTLDMHRDMAAECFLLPKKLVTKDIRHMGKNGFVFPEFYGSYHENVAKELWITMDLVGSELKDGTPLKSHLADQGVFDLDGFIEVIKKTEDIFWKKRFPVYDSWRRDLWKFYEQHGYVDMLTGFRCQDYATRNEIINRPIQGAAFHCLLWSLTRIQEETTTRDMESLIVGQIHDSLILDVVESEFEELMSIVKRVMTRDIRRHWKWIIVPMEVDIEAAPIDGSWHEKKKYKLAA